MCSTDAQQAHLIDNWPPKPVVLERPFKGTADVFCRVWASKTHAHLSFTFLEIPMPTTKKQRSKVARQKREIRNSVWPELDEDGLWSSDKSDGWLTVPRAMPLILKIMDSLSGKGKPVSPTYFDLWCRTFNDSFLTVNKPREMSFYSGFGGERGERTWASRMKILKELGFIDYREGSNGPISYVLILNPYHVIKQHHLDGRLSPTLYNALRERTIEIGAPDLNDDE